MKPVAPWFGNALCAALGLSLVPSGPLHVLFIAAFWFCLAIVVAQVVDFLRDS